MRYLSALSIIVLLAFCLSTGSTHPILNKATLRVLDIGNSFTNDATNLLPLIAEASGSDISNICLYKAVRSSGTLKSWYDVYCDKDTAYRYRIEKVFGGLSANVRTGRGAKGDGSLFRKLLTDEQWDIIIIQPYYGLWSDAGRGPYLNEMLSVIKEHQPNAVIGFHIVHSLWDHHAKNKEGSSYERWKLICSSTKKIQEEYGIDFIIPYGTAIENLRSSSLNNEYDLTRDGLHLAYGLGRYTAACCYYESLIAPRSGISVLGNAARYDASQAPSSEYPSISVTDENALIVQKAAYLATNDMYHCYNPESGSIVVNKYKLIYMVDGVEYKTLEIEYGAQITPEPAPTKEGYTFSGWSDIPSTMPAKDVTVTGSFTVNKYKLIYMVDGVEYKTQEIEYGAKITPEADPTKEGYSFSGWSDIPTTMPAKDVIVTGSFTQVDYKIGDVIYEITGEKTVSIKDSEQKGSVDIATTVDIEGQTYMVTAIETKAFKDNKDITSVTIPNGIYTIGYKAFKGCTGLTEINIGKDVNSIDYQAFANVGTEASAGTRSENGSIHVNCYAKSVPLTSADAFDNTPIETGTLLVEDTSVDAYKTTSPWNRFGTIMGFDEASGIKSMIKDSQKARIYDMLGNRIGQPKKGINIIRMNDGRTKKVIVSVSEMIL